MPYKRKRPSVTRAVRTALRVGNTKSLASAGRSLYKRRRTGAGSLQRQVSALTRTIELKDQVWTSGTNIALPHNKLYAVLGAGSGGRLNIFQVDVGAADSMTNGGGRRVGDEITIKNVVIRGMLENALARSKVNYRVMLIRAAKGDTPTRDTLFRGNCGNKLIDGINTERFTIVTQRVMTISGQGATSANSVSATGIPLEAPTIGGDYVGGIGSKVFTITIPGSKFGRGGRIQYENNSATQVKFYDYHLMIMTYDWYGTPETNADLSSNTVGRINELYAKIYYKDA